MERNCKTLASYNLIIRRSVFICKLEISRPECYKLTMDEGGRGYDVPPTYRIKRDPALKVVQARPLGYRRDEPLIKRFSRRILVPLGLATLFGIGAYEVVQQAGDQSRPGETQPYHQNVWADQIRQELDTKTFREGEELRKDVAVAAGSEPPIEWVNDEPRLSTSVEVYDGYPSPYIMSENGSFIDFTPTLGRIELGTVLPEVLMVDGMGVNDLQEYVPTRYGAFKAGNLTIIGNDGNPVKTSPDQIAVVNASFLESPQPQQ